MFIFSSIIPSWSTSMKVPWQLEKAFCLLPLWYVKVTHPMHFSLYICYLRFRKLKDAISSRFFSALLLLLMIERWSTYYLLAPMLFPICDWPSHKKELLRNGGSSSKNDFFNPTLVLCTLFYFILIFFFLYFLRWHTGSKIQIWSQNSFRSKIIIFGTFMNYESKCGQITKKNLGWLTLE